MTLQYWSKALYPRLSYIFQPIGKEDFIILLVPQYLVNTIQYSVLLLLFSKLLERHTCLSYAALQSISFQRIQVAFCPWTAWPCGAEPLGCLLCLSTVAIGLDQLNLLRKNHQHQIYYPDLRWLLRFYPKNMKDNHAIGQRFVHFICSFDNFRMQDQHVYVGLANSDVILSSVRWE